METLQTRLAKQLDDLARSGFDAQPLVFEPPASIAEVNTLENGLGFPLPPAFRHLLLNVSRRIAYSWFCPAGHSFPDPFGSNFRGDLSWSVDALLEIQADYAGWRDTVFANRNNPYHAVWHEKLAFLAVGNGDFLAIDVASGGHEAIVYLSHDDGAGHGFLLAEDIEQLIERWVPLACPGAEDWQWLPFCSSKTGFIDPSGEPAARWRGLLGMNA